MPKTQKKITLLMVGLVLLLGIWFNYEWSQVRHYSADEFDLAQVYAHFGPGQISVVVKTPVSPSEPYDPPEIVKQLNYISYYYSADGTWIKLNEFIVMESGLFIPYDSENFHPEKDGDPEFRYLGHGVYCYLVRG